MSGIFNENTIPKQKNAEDYKNIVKSKEEMYNFLRYECKINIKIILIKIIFLFMQYKRSSIFTNFLSMPN